MRRAFGIVRKNLQLFLDFKKSELVGGELVVKDKSLNTNNAKLFTGKALSFDGSNDYVELGNPSVNLKSICFWVDLDTTTEQIINLTSTHSIEVVSGVITLNGAWSNSNIYVDGIATTSIGTTVKRVVVTTDTNILVDDLKFGRIGVNYGSFDLADVQIWDYEFTQADVTFDYNHPNHLATDNAASSLNISNLKGLWHLSEGAGGICYDSSGQGNNGTINGASWLTTQPTIAQLGMMDWSKSTPVADEITLISNPNNPSQDILGNTVRLREHGFNLDGTGYVEVADDNTLDFGTGDFSLECWAIGSFVYQASSLNMILSMGGNGAAPNSISIVTEQSTSKIGAYVNGVAVWSDSSFTSGAWYHITLVRDSGMIKLYINAELQTDTASSSGDVSNASVKYIGRDGNSGRQYNDLIDESKAYNRGLSLKEIEQNYKAGLNKHKTGSSFSDDFSSDYGL